MPSNSVTRPAGPHDSRDLEETISREAGEAGLFLPAAAPGALALHLAMMLRWNRAMSLTSITDPAEAIRKHVLESLQAAAHVRPEAGGLLDIGSGNGYPALPVKVLHPGVPATLLEPAMRKSVFLESVARAAGLAGVVVRRQRVARPRDLERYPGTGTITLRAVGVIGQVLEGASRILPPGGRVILFVGARKGEELAAALPAPLGVAAREALRYRPGGSLLVLERR